MKTDQPKKLFDRQISEHRCFLFGHYDSRGCATLVEAKHLVEAITKYAQAFGFDENPEEWKPDTLHTLIEEDFMFSAHVVFCDAGPEGECDLDYRYDGKFHYGTLQFRYKGKLDPTKWSSWNDASNESGCKKTLVLWVGKNKPAPNRDAFPNWMTEIEFRIVSQAYGEDAAGLVWQE